MWKNFHAIEVKENQFNVNGSWFALSNQPQIELESFIPWILIYTMNASWLSEKFVVIFYRNLGIKLSSRITSLIKLLL